MKMKFYFALILISIIYISCEENFSPQATYDERYSLNCIIRGDTSFHVATTYKSYEVPNNDPYENKKDSFIDDVFIRIWRGKHEVHIFRDSTTERRDTSRYNTDIKYYYIDNFVPNEGDSLEIEAILPNGRKLRSNTKIPSKVRRNNEDSDIEITRDLKDYLKTQWIIKNQDQVYLPKLIIDYFVNENGVNIRKKAIIPWKKIQTGNGIQYLYPIPSKDYFVNYELGIIKAAMKDISKNDSTKSKYIIISLALELSIFDENLSAYYYTVGYNDNSFAVGLDEGDFTNVENGFGIFGSFYTQKFKIELSKSYVISFGYILYE